MLRFIGTGPSVVFVVDDPLQAVHGRFVEFLCDEVILEGACADVRADAHIDERRIGCGPGEVESEPSAILPVAAAMPMQAVPC